MRTSRCATVAVLRSLLDRALRPLAISLPELDPTQLACGPGGRPTHQWSMDRPPSSAILLRYSRSDGVFDPDRCVTGCRTGRVTKLLDEVRVPAQCFHDEFTASGSQTTPSSLAGASRVERRSAGRPTPQAPALSPLRAWRLRANCP
jgi:hypothetical protein